MDTKRIPVNFRAFLIVAACIAVAVLCAYIYMLSHVAGIVIGALYIAAIFAVCVVFCVKYIRKSAKLRVFIAFCIAAVFSVLSFCLAVAYIVDREKSMSFGGYHDISGRVCDVYDSNGDQRIELGDLTIDGVHVNGKLRVNAVSSDKSIADIVGCGDRLDFSAFISVRALVEDGRVNGGSYRTDIRYFANIYASTDVRITFGEPNIIESFLSGFHSLLTQNMGDDYGNIAYSMVTGDKHLLDSDIRDYYSAAGLGHIMAVSGLHVGFLTLMLNLMLCKVGKKVRFGIISVFLLAYCVLANFSPSVVRATIMAIISMLALFVGGRKDLLSSLCAAFSLILAVKPLYLFDAGFLMSFGAIFGIALFSNTISRALIKRDVPRKIAGGMSSAVSVQAGIIPTEVWFYNEIRPLALLVNVIVIPYVTVVFIVIVLCSVIAAIPGCGPALKAAEYLLLPLDYVAMGIAQVPGSSVSAYPTGAVFLCYPIMFCASEFFMMKRGKPSVALASFAACIALVALGMPTSDGVIAVVDSSSTESVVCDGGSVYVIGYATNSYAIKRQLKKQNCRRIDAVYLLGNGRDTVDCILTLRQKYDIDKVYGYELSENGIRLMAAGIDFSVYDGTGDSEVKLATYAGKIVGYEYKNVLFALDNADERAFSGYSAVRVKTVNYLQYYSPSVEYLCNYSTKAVPDVRTLSNSDYVYGLT